VPIIILGGGILALLLSFPVRALSHLMPRGVALLVTCLGLLGALGGGLFFIVPLLIEQLTGFVAAVPDYALRGSRALREVLEPLRERDLLPGEPNDLVADLEQGLFVRAQRWAQGLLVDLLGAAQGFLGVALRLFGMIFIAIYLLLDIRRLKAAYLRLLARRYRRDARELWDAFGISLSRYLGGLLLIMVAQGALTAVALSFLGVPYAILLGAWVAATAVIPNLGAWLGAVPAVILAYFVSPLTALWAALLYVFIQQFESYVLTPRIQGQVVRVHPAAILLTVIGAAEVFGLAGAVLAVPALAVLRVFYDFFRVRLRVDPS
jgi:predicted PurR-regulated permease PerM